VKLVYLFISFTWYLLKSPEGNWDSPPITGPSEDEPELSFEELLEQEQPMRFNTIFKWAINKGYHGDLMI